MGIEMSKLGPAAHKAAKAKRAAGRPRLDSQLEGRFAYLLKEARVVKWKLHAKIEPMGTDHSADFLWLDVPFRGHRRVSCRLAVFIDGGVHKLKLAEDCRRDSICAMLAPEWTVLRFADTQLELGSQCVNLWHQGDLLGMLTALRNWRAP